MHLKADSLGLRKTARFAGFLYILTCIPSPMALIYVPAHIIVDGNPNATNQNILNHEFLFRLSIVSQLVSLILFVYLALTLCRLFNNVNHSQTRLLFAFVLVQVPLAFIFETFNFTALMIAKNDILIGVPVDQKQQLIMLLLNMHQYGIMTLEIFWGLWLIPFGLLVYQSGFIPRIFALCLFIGGVGWIVDSTTYLLLPVSHHFIGQYITVIGAIGEFPIIMWLLIKGVRSDRILSLNHGK